jgi:hypothetical protein
MRLLVLERARCRRRTTDPPGLVSIACPGLMIAIDRPSRDVSRARGPQLRQAGDEALPFAELHAAGITSPAASFLSLSRTDTSCSASVSTTGRSACARARTSGHILGARLAQVAPIANRGTSRDHRGLPRLGLAFPRRRLSSPCRARFGSEGSARGRIDALVAIVPADAIPRRGVAAQHFLNDTGAGSAAR